MKKREDIYQGLTEFYKKNQRMPSYAEVCEALHISSKSVAHAVVASCIKDGFLSKDTKGKLVPGDMFTFHDARLRVLGYVEAGFPSPAEEDVLDSISLDEWIIGKREATFMLKVKGDSMIDAGIHNGDMVIVERGRQAKPGEIVIANIDEGFTLKYLRKQSGKFFLEAANEDYKDMYPVTSLQIVATVVAVVRKYD